MKDTSKAESDRDEAVTNILGEWLQFYGPVTTGFVEKTTGIDAQDLSVILEDLIDSQQIIMGQLVTDDAGNSICDSENFEVLLRLSRASAVPVFEPLSVKQLQLFLAHHHGFTSPGDNIDSLFRSMEQLLCLPLPAALWESEVLPARVHPYSTSHLDTMMQEGNLRWVGNENHRVSFCFETDLDLMKNDINNPAGETEEKDEENGLHNLFPGTGGKYDFSALLTSSGYRPDELSDKLWKAVWDGKVTNDTFAALRRGIENRFSVPKVINNSAGIHRRGRRSGGRTGFARWKGSLPFAGNWMQLPQPEPERDVLETEELVKDRARLLLDRYGIIFRELLEKEFPVFRWSNIFRSLRLMELSGEVLAGYFFHGIPGPQFMSHQAFRLLQRKLPEDKIYWINATDPASLCGAQLEPLKGILPKRLVTTHLVFRGVTLVAVSNRNGRNLTFNVPPDDITLPEYLAPLHHILWRQFQPLRRITIETINGEEASTSPYVDILRTAFDITIENRNVILYRKTN